MADMEDWHDEMEGCRCEMEGRVAVVLEHAYPSR